MNKILRTLVCHCVTVLLLAGNVDCDPNRDKGERRPRGSGRKVPLSFNRQAVLGIRNAWRNWRENSRAALRHVCGWYQWRKPVVLPVYSKAALQEAYVQYRDPNSPLSRLLKEVLKTLDESPSWKGEAVKKELKEVFVTYLKREGLSKNMLRSISQRRGNKELQQTEATIQALVAREQEREKASSKRRKGLTAAVFVGKASVVLFAFVNILSYLIAYAHGVELTLEGDELAMHDLEGDVGEVEADAKGVETGAGEIENDANQITSLKLMDLVNGHNLVPIESEVVEIANEQGVSTQYLLDHETGALTDGEGLVRGYIHPGTGHLIAVVPGEGNLLPIVGGDAPMIPSEGIPPGEESAALSHAYKFHVVDGVIHPTELLGTVNEEGQVIDSQGGVIQMLQTSDLPDPIEAPLQGGDVDAMYGHSSELKIDHPGSSALAETADPASTYTPPIKPVLSQTASGILLGVGIVLPTCGIARGLESAVYSDKDRNTKQALKVVGEAFWEAATERTS